MTTTDQVGPSTTSLDQYRAAERQLWDRYGLEAEERFIALESPDIRVRVVEVGEGKPVLFIPGTAGTGPLWAPLLAALKGFRCLLFDRPGFGLSDVVDFSKHDYKQLTSKLLTGVLDALDIEQVSVVGQSIGTAWALQLAASQPSRVERVILLGAGPLTNEIRPPTFIKLLASPLGALIVRLPMKPGMVRKQFQGLGHGKSLDAGRIPEEFFAWRTAFANKTKSMHSERRMVQAVLRPDGWATSFSDAELKTVRQPVLMLYGTADPTGSPDLWEAFVGGMAQGELDLVPDAGHIPWLDEPTKIGNRIETFLTT